jgi:hypothetical protein
VQLEIIRVAVGQGQARENHHSRRDARHDSRTLGSWTCMCRAHLMSPIWYRKSY